MDSFIYIDLFLLLLTNSRDRKCKCNFMFKLNHLIVQFNCTFNTIYDHKLSFRSNGVGITFSESDATAAFAAATVTTTSFQRTCHLTSFIVFFPMEL